MDDEVHFPSQTRGRHDLGSEGASIGEVYELVNDTRSELTATFREGMHELSGEIHDLVSAVNKSSVEQASVNADINARVKALESDHRWERVERLVHGAISGGVAGGIMTILLKFFGVGSIPGH